MHTFIFTSKLSSFGMELSHIFKTSFIVVLKSLFTPGANISFSLAQAIIIACKLFLVFTTSEKIEN